METIDFEYLFSLPPYSLDRERKTELYDSFLAGLSAHHCQNCREYRRIISIAGENAPIPVRLFKEYELRSIPPEEVIKTMTSSGTTGQRVSKIYLDRETSARQSRALSKIISDFTGKTRLPMLVIDSKAVLKNRNMFSARGAGILGFSMLGRDLTYALDENMELDWPVLEAFCEKYRDQDVFMFGFTYMIWRHFYQPLNRRSRRLPLKGVMIHGGGWKKLQDSAVSAEAFRTGLMQVTKLDKVLNYYGMVEQTGSVFVECEHGHMHCSNYSDIVIRRPQDFSVAEQGERGLIELRSLLPTSYPGHILLTEDEGEILGEDDCPCGRKGKYFKIHGRMKGAEIRGCSDTYERR